MQLQPRQLPTADVGLKTQHRRRCGPGRARRDPQRRKLPIRDRLHQPDCACRTASGHLMVISLALPPCRGTTRTAGWRASRDRTKREDHVTEPDIEVPEADRAEQEESVDPSAPELAGEATPPGPGVREADALEQQLSARPGESCPPLGSGGGR